MCFILIFSLLGGGFGGGDRRTEVIVDGELHNSLICFMHLILQMLLMLQLDALIHPFFDELRDPNARLPNGRFLPPLFNFKSHGRNDSAMFSLS